MKLEQMKVLLRERKLDAVLAACPANIRYLSGFAGTESYLYVSEKRGVILTDSRYTLQAEEEGKGCEVRTIRRDLGYGKLLAQLLKEEQVENLGFEEDAMLYGTVRELQQEAGLPPERWRMLGDALSSFRKIKSPEELDRMERAERIGDEAFSYILNELKPGVTELQIADDEDVTAEDEIKSQDELQETQTAFGQANVDKGTDDLNVVRTLKDEVIVEEKKPEPEKVFTAVEQMPQFPGGDAELMKWLSKNIKYPTMAMENNIQGQVIVQFVVTKTGDVGEVKVVRSVDKDLDREAVRVCKSLPKFIPGKMNGQAVNVWYTLPVRFKLQGLN